MREDVPVPGAAAGTVAERTVDLHVVRTPDHAGEAATGAAPVMPDWEIAWRRSLRLQGREPSTPEYFAKMDYEYCRELRDARAEGRDPITKDAFYRR